MKFQHHSENLPEHHWKRYMHKLVCCWKTYERMAVQVRLCRYRTWWIASGSFHRCEETRLSPFP